MRGTGSWIMTCAFLFWGFFTYLGLYIELASCFAHVATALDTHNPSAIQRAGRTAVGLERLDTQLGNGRHCQGQEGIRTGDLVRPSPAGCNKGSS